MKKKDVIFSALICCLGFFCIILLVKNNSLKDANDIFNISASSIVEVKASTETVGESFGTGVIYDSNLLITNAHVVTYTKLGEPTQFDEYYIRLITDEKFISAELVKFDIDKDLAILKIIDESLEFTKIKFDNSSLKYGQQVFAIGNTSNYGIGISEGIISVPLVNVKYGEIERQVIQVDISISTGNSGGALVNNKGELIGITTFRTKDGNGNVNYGFAYCIPINVVNEYIGGERI